MGKGHWVQLCPTNMDPAFDRPPEPDYKCLICGRVGDHFATLCEHNIRQVSLYQQRKRAGNKKKVAYPDSDASRDRSYRDRRSPSLVDERRRSRSPDRRRRSTRYDKHDRYAPGSSKYITRGESSPERRRAPSPRYEVSSGARELRARSWREELPIGRGRDSLHSRKLTFPVQSGGDRGKERVKQIDYLRPKSREGRLSFEDDDDDIFIDSDQPLPTPKAKRKPSQHDLDRPVGDKKATRRVHFELPVIQEPSETAVRAMEDFLCALENEISTSPPTGDEMEVDTVLEVSDKTQHGAVSEHGSPRGVLAVIRKQQGPDVRSRPNRKTALEMWELSDHHREKTPAEASQIMEY